MEGVISGADRYPRQHTDGWVLRLTGDGRPCVREQLLGQLGLDDAVVPGESMVEAKQASGAS